ncbi:MAG: hypothetical protein WCD79_15870 [Chthoniobacteraceae bacterium]
MKTSPVLCAILLACCPVIARAEPPLYAHKEKPAPAFIWLDEIKNHVPVLKHERGDRLPMILWQAGPFEPQSPEVYQSLLARGLTQHIHLDEKMIPIAKALQAAGSPVIMMEGEGGQWPSSLAGDPKEWQHDFDPGYTPKGPTHACPLLTKGWQISADKIRVTLQKFKDAGVAVDAVWMDWEGDPVGGADRYEQALHCRRCRAILPPGTLATEQAFNDYCWRRYMELTGTYLAAPVAEIFPACSTTNWHATVSTPARPVRNWLDHPICPVVPPLFTASNPVAYGNTVFMHLWKAAWKFDREHVDQFYTHMLLSEVSDDTANRLVWAPGRASIPWVCRWCPDDDSPKIPIMTRERYREVLRHLWLRGINGMQIFNPVRPGYETLAVNEVQDATAIYDEMLQYRDFLDLGTPLSLDVPKMQDEGIIWSGLLLKDRAIVRIFKQGIGSAKVTIEPWPDSKITLEATPAGKTYLLVLKDGKARVSE